MCTIHMYVLRMLSLHHRHLPLASSLFYVSRISHPCPHIVLIFQKMCDLDFAVSLIKAFSSRFFHCIDLEFSSNFILVSYDSRLFLVFRCLPDHCLTPTYLLFVHFSCFSWAEIYYCLKKKMPFRESLYNYVFPVNSFGFRLHGAYTPVFIVLTTVLFGIGLRSDLKTHSHETYKMYCKGIFYLYRN